MPITEEQDDKINDDLEKQIDDQHPDKTPDGDNSEKDKHGSEKSEDSKPYWEQKGFASEAEFVKSYDNAQSLIGTQGTELGELRKLKDPPAKEDTPENEPYDKYDPYDEDNAKYFQQKWAKEALVEQKTKEEADTQAANKEAARLKMVGKFIESHTGGDNPLTETKMKEVATFARDRGIYDLQDAFLVMNANNGTHSEDGKKSELGKQVNDLPHTLTDTGSSGKADHTVADLSQEDYEKLPADQREEALRNAPGG